MTQSYKKLGGDGFRCWPSNRLCSLVKAAEDVEQLSFVNVSPVVTWIQGARIPKTGPDWIGGVARVP